jgi:hypothetical protein
MTEEQGLGASIKRAVEFLKGIHEDVFALVKSIDRLLAEHDWTDAIGNRISVELGNSLNAPAWVLPTLTRIYVPTGGLERTGSALSALIDFAPAAFDEAMVFVAGVHFHEPVNARDNVWNAWKRHDRALEFLREPDGPVELPRALLDDDLFPQASRGRAFRTPLCALTDQSALLERLVLPGLKLLM